MPLSVFGRLGLAGMMLALLAGCSRPQPVPPGYPRGYSDLIEGAAGEGRLLIWSATDRAKAARLVAAFGHRYPHIRVSFVEMPAASINDRFLTALATHRETPDILWSSAMDLQIKLSNDGQAQTYLSPEAGHLSRETNWKNQAWGTTAEPVVLLYNRRLVAPDVVPRDRSALTRLLEADRAACRYRVATYDLTRSAVGYLYLSQDAQASPDAWRLIDAMRGCHGHLYAHAEEMLHAVRASEAAFAYNVIGSYALEEARKDPVLGIVLLRDYTLLMSRIALITAGAAHPDSARLFIDFLLSREGQARLVAEGMPAVRDDVGGLPQLRAPRCPVPCHQGRARAADDAGPADPRRLSAPVGRPDALTCAGRLADVMRRKAKLPWRP